MSTENAIQGLGEARSIALADLLLDDMNPRLPPSQQGLSQVDLAVVLEMGFEAFTVAESIARFGFFSSEPLIAIPAKEDGKFIVVEGNRRLTALLGLTHDDMRSEFATPERWEALAAESEITSETRVPVVVATSREACTPVIGYRHISGILQWSPFAQARYVAVLVNNEHRSYQEVAQLIGKDKSAVAALYRDQAIADQAIRMGIDTGGLESAFSLLQVAMSSTKIRDFVGAPLGARTVPGLDPIPGDKVAELGEVLGYVFGSGEREPVINDSRQISQLGNIIAEPVGLKALRDGETLEVAKQKITDTGADPKDRLKKRLTTAKNALLAAVEDIGPFYDDEEILDLIAEVSSAVRELEQQES
ncbi:MAG: hypothetical protein HKL85_09535 [Acidimicrobiaceae bacterium]|nr:hypothetical protein [Acidimicrobiaceae bacterium]